MRWSGLALLSVLADGSDCSILSSGYTTLDTTISSKTSGTSGILAGITGALTGFELTPETARASRCEFDAELVPVRLKSDRPASTTRFSISGMEGSRIFFRTDCCCSGRAASWHNMFCRDENPINHELGNEMS
jgi:hypothetical protein